MSSKFQLLVEFSVINNDNEKYFNIVLEKNTPKVSVVTRVNNENVC